jgi:integrase
VPCPVLHRIAFPVVSGQGLALTLAALERAKTVNAGISSTAVESAITGMSPPCSVHLAMAPRKIVNRHFKPLLKRAGLPSIRWHDLRHTYATLFLARGTHPTYVQKSLGHATVQLTLAATPTGCRAWAATPPKG